MTTRSGNGLPSRGPLHRLGDAPGLPSKPGGPAPFQPRELTEAEEFPGPEAQSTIRTASLESPVVAPAVGAPPPLVEEGAEAPLPTLVIPRTFEELLFHAILVTPSRELPVVVEQVIAPGASGSITVGIPLAKVDVARTFREGGDGSVSYRIEIDGAGRLAVANHRVTGAERQFGRFFEKYNSVIITFTNNDLLNPAFLQVEWISVQMDTAKWTTYRDNIRAWSKLLGVTE
ncbi:MAG: hypothetical protein Q7K03_07310 [Dehalococcoidia bacterium]|nr:hypothetical protein [Dehalococcoidia bacterium]